MSRGWVEPRKTKPVSISNLVRTCGNNYESSVLIKFVMIKLRISFLKDNE